MNDIKIIKSINNKSKFIGVYSRNNLPKIKVWAYVINFNDKQSKGTQWISLFFGKNAVMLFDSIEILLILEFLILLILLELFWTLLNIFLKKYRARRKSTAHKIFKKQPDESIMCGFYRVAFIEYVISGKSLIDFTNELLPITIKRFASYYISTLKTHITKENMTLVLRLKE